MQGVAETAPGSNQVTAAFNDGGQKRISDFALIIVGKNGIVNVAENVKRGIFPSVFCLGRNNFPDLGNEPGFLRLCGYSEAFGKRLGDFGKLFCRIPPEIWIQRPFITARVGHVKDIAQTGLTGIRVVDQGNPIAAAPYIAAHSPVPGVVIGAGSRAGSLGENQKLIRKRVFVKPCSSAEECGPIINVPDDFPRGIICERKIKRQLIVWHVCLLFKNNRSRTGPARVRVGPVHSLLNRGNPRSDPARRSLHRSSAGDEPRRPWYFLAAYPPGDRPG